MKPNKNIDKNRYQWAHETISNLVNNHQVNTLYDIGARDGVLKKHINNINLKYFGFDLEPLDNEIKKWDLEEPNPYDLPKADCIAFLDILEHLNNPWLSIKNLSNVLKPNGYLILTTPNPHWSRSRINFISKGFLNCFTTEDLKNNHHVFTPWPHIVKKLLEDNGFEIVEYSTIDGTTKLFEKPLSFLLPFQLLIRSIKIIIEKIDNKSCGMSYAIIAKKNKLTLSLPIQTKW